MWLQKYGSEYVAQITQLQIPHILLHWIDSNANHFMHMSKGVLDFIIHIDVIGRLYPCKLNMQ